MKLVNISVSTSVDAFFSAIKNQDEVNRGVVFDEKLGTPKMKVKEKKNGFVLTCELMNRATKDNGFLVGTYFRGRITEKDGVATLRGAIVTAPIYHFALIALFIGFIVMCIVKGGFSVMPLLLIGFDIVMFSLEFKKQGIIKRYLLRAARFAERGGRPNARTF